MVSGQQNCLVINILQNIFFYVPQEKERHTGLKQHELSRVQWVNDDFFLFILDEL